MLEESYLYDYIYFKTLTIFFIIIINSEASVLLIIYAACFPLSLPYFFVVDINSY